MPTYKTGNGRKVATANAISAGGEGEVYELQGVQDRVCKIYKPENQTREREQKLEAMIESKVSLDEDYRYLTWPQELLYDINNERFVGYIMHRSQAECALIRCINPVHRRKSTQLWARKGEYGLYVIAYNLALAFDTCHRNDICIGDVNESNIMVTSEGLPVLIDNDSFQVPNPSNPAHPFLSPVIQPDFTPPERTSASRAIGPEQDNFGLAVIIYKLLHNGIHPFVGRDSNGIRHIPDIPGRIMAHRFVHAKNAGRQWEADAKQLNQWRGLSERTRTLFMRALDYRNHGVQRPTATEWKDSIGRDIDERWPASDAPVAAPVSNPSFVEETRAPYQATPSPNHPAPRKTCQCTKCSCQEAAKYAYCNHCGLNHEMTIVKCRCDCQCDEIHPRKYAICYKCNNGRHKSGIRHQGTVYTPSEGYDWPERYDWWDALDDLPF